MEILSPIARVANAAMVLSDTIISNMTFEEMQKVIRPKVDGSRFLDAVFPHNSLDFFILFGSSIDIMGNLEQAEYCAGSMFMSSLVCSRRPQPGWESDWAGRSQGRGICSEGEAAT